MGDRVYQLIQGVKVSGQQVDLSLLQQSTYTETLDLTGPRLVLIVDDRFQVVRDAYGIDEGSLLSVDFGNPTDADTVGFSDDFVVISCIEQSAGVHKIECLAKAVHDLKRRTVQAQSFIRFPPADVVASLTQSSVKSSDLPAVEDYYLLSGTRPSRLIKHLAIESGARCYYRRGIWHLTSIDDLLSSPLVAGDYSTGSSSAVRRKIIAPTMQRVAGMVSELVEARYVGFTIAAGVIEAGEGSAHPVGATSEITLANLQKTLTPQMSFRIEGGDIERMAGDRLGIHWGRAYSNDAPINESLPAEVLISSISHAQIGTSMHALVRTSA